MSKNNVEAKRRTEKIVDHLQDAISCISGIGREVPSETALHEALKKALHEALIADEISYQRDLSHRLFAHLNELREQMAVLEAQLAR